MSFKSNLLENYIFRFGDYILGTQVIHQLNRHRKFSCLNQNEILTLQREKLNDLLNHATNTCKFYNEYKNQKINDNDPFKWIKNFPIINKHNTIINQNEMLSSNYNKTDLIKYESSGSTGVRSSVYIDKKEQSIMRAILLNWWEWNGYRLGSPILQTGITPKRGFLKSLKDLLLSTIYVDAFSSDEKTSIYKLNQAKKYKNCILFGFASSLYNLAEVAEKNDIKITFSIAMSQGDKLFNHYKKKIEKVFNCKVVEDYGLNEGFMIGQKKDLPFFYYYQPSVYIEILDENNCEVEDGEMGRIIATKLDGYAMPLIRYDTGDIGIMLNKKEYPNDRNLDFKLIKMIVGRNTDIIETFDHKKLIVHTFTGIFEFFPQIKQFQIIQKSKKLLIFKYVKSNKYYDSVLFEIESVFREKTKSMIKIEWREVEKIENSKSGKPQIVINKLIDKSLTEEVK